MSLDQFDSGFKPENEYNIPQISVLTNGAYRLLVRSVDLKPTKSGTILRWRLEVKEGPSHVGLIVEHVHFLDSQEGVNRLGADLMLLGIPVNEWTVANGRPFSQQLPIAVQTMRGIEIAAEKTSSDGRDNNKVYHYLNFRSKTQSAPMPDMPF